MTFRRFSNELHDGGALATAHASHALVGFVTNEDEVGEARFTVTYGR